MMYAMLSIPSNVDLREPARVATPDPFQVRLRAAGERFRCAWARRRAETKRLGDLAADLSRNAERLAESTARLARCMRECGL
jgi:hypothetical protein